MRTANIQSFFVLAGKGQCGVLLFQENPVDPSMNEHYLWHGCKPEGAEGITDANFDLKRDSVRWPCPESDIQQLCHCLLESMSLSPTPYPILIYIYAVALVEPPMFSWSRKQDHGFSSF